MIGLYLLTTSLLKKLKVIKFGMSMRLEYRWIDYLQTFGDAEYAYYYQFHDDLPKTHIINIEKEILLLYKDKRSLFFQTEYFNCDDYKEFNDCIIRILDKRHINYTSYNIHNFDKKKYYDNKPEIFIQSNINENKQELDIKEVIPQPHQQKVLDKVEDYYKKTNILKLIWACGLGKALLAIFIVQKLNSKMGICKMVLIGVPSVNLQKQMKNEIMKIFNNHENILYVGGNIERTDNYTIESTTNKDYINDFINKHTNECKFIITTYASCGLLEDFVFDFKIGDEAHHLVGSDMEKTKQSFHKIKADKTLFMTATEKIIENKSLHSVYSMDDKTIFGDYLGKEYTIKEAIEQKKITDYYLILLKNTKEDINNILNSVKDIDNKELFLAAFMALKSIEKYNDLTHILIYTNTTDSAELVKSYVDMILDLNIINITKTNYYNRALHSNIHDIKDESIKAFKTCDEVTEFKNATWGIISGVYIFGEGFDCPKLNGVVFAENMDSDIRIVQSTLRPNRLDKMNPDKRAYVIIPYSDCNESFDKCRKIIAKIRTVDENIEHKMTVVSFKHSLSTSPTVKQIHHDIMTNGDELKRIILKLKHSKDLANDLSEEQNEYNYIKELNKMLNIKSKEEYVDMKEKHDNYIDKPDEYFISKCVWKDWYDFLGFDTSKFIQNKDDWIKFCKRNNVKSLEDYNELCKSYEELPKNPADYYKDYSNISKELGINRNRR